MIWLRYSPDLGGARYPGKISRQGIEVCRDRPDNVRDVFLAMLPGHDLTD